MGEAKWRRLVQTSCPLVPVQIEVSPGEFIERHTHPGLELTYLL
jgi:quercetin dioxygenase-like cupin family protein